MCAHDRQTDRNTPFFSFFKKWELTLSDLLGTLFRRMQSQNRNSAILNRVDSSCYRILKVFSSIPIAVRNTAFPPNIWQPKFSQDIAVRGISLAHSPLGQDVVHVLTPGFNPSSHQTKSISLALNFINIHKNFPVGNMKLIIQMEEKLVLCFLKQSYSLSKLYTKCLGPQDAPLCPDSSGNLGRNRANDLHCLQNQ